MRTKVLFVVAVLVAVSAGTGATAVLALKDLSAGAAEMTVAQESAAAMAQVHQEQITSRLIVAEAGASVTVTEAQQDAYLSQIAATDADLDAAVAHYIGLARGYDTSAIADFQRTWASWRTSRDSSAVPAAFANDTSAVAMTLMLLKPALEHAEAALEDEDAAIADLVRSTSSEAAATADRADGRSTHDRPDLAAGRARRRR